MIAQAKSFYKAKVDNASAKDLFHIVSNLLKSSIYKLLSVYDSTVTVCNFFAAASFFFF